MRHLVPVLTQNHSRRQLNKTGKTHSASQISDEGNDTVLAKERHSLFFFSAESSYGPRALLTEWPCHGRPPSADRGTYGPGWLWGAEKVVLGEPNSVASTQYLSSVFFFPPWGKGNTGPSSTTLLNAENLSYPKSWLPSGGSLTRELVRCMQSPGPVPPAPAL